MRPSPLTRPGPHGRGDKEGPASRHSSLLGQGTPRTPHGTRGQMGCLSPTGRGGLPGSRSPSSGHPVKTLTGNRPAPLCWEDPPKAPNSTPQRQRGGPPRRATGGAEHQDGAPPSGCPRGEHRTQSLALSPPRGPTPRRPGEPALWGARDLPTPSTRWDHPLGHGGFLRQNLSGFQSRSHQADWTEKPTASRQQGAWPVSGTRTPPSPGSTTAHTQGRKPTLAGKPQLFWQPTRDSALSLLGAWVPSLLGNWDPTSRAVRAIPTKN